MFRYNLILFVVIESIMCVPPSPTDRLQDDVAQIKRNMKSFTAQLEKLNIVYLTQIEPRLLSSNTRLSSIDSNIKNLQERAHVWDTFQLHVTAWNDQLASLDRKMDIISKGQEKMLMADAKINAITNIEYKIENILKKLEGTEDTLELISKKFSNQNTNQNILFGEFATRGILSTLKHIEKKLDRLHLNGQNVVGRLKQSGEDSRPKMPIKCNTPPVLEELLSDVSSKVDVIFDKIGDKDEDLPEEDYLEDQENSGEPVETKMHSDIKLFQNVLKRINHPCKQTNKILDAIRDSTSIIRNNTSILIGSCGIIETNEPACLKYNDAYEFNQNLTMLLQYLIKSESDRDAAMFSFLQEQAHSYESMLKKQLENYFFKPPSILKIDNTDLPEIENTTTHEGTEKKYFTITDNTYTSTCDNLKQGDDSGVYFLSEAQSLSGNGRNYNIRYCQHSPNGFWTVIQRRDYYQPSENFTQSWINYKYGFGQLEKDFWFGNEFIYLLSQERNLTLRIELEDFECNFVWAEYTPFSILSEDENYKLIVGGYSGNASDSLTSHNGSFFSTFDVKNDQAPACCPCAVSYGGGWWFNSCFESNLNGVYYDNPSTNEYFRGIIWENWRGNYSLKRTLMLVKAAENHTKDEEFDVGFDSTLATGNSSIPFYEDP